MRNAFDVAREALLARFGTLDPDRLRLLGADDVQIGAARNINARAFAAQHGRETCDPSGDARLIADLRAQNAALQARWHGTTPAEQAAARWLADALDDLPFPAGGDVLVAYERLLGAIKRCLATPHEGGA